jgi:hypothetical protein
MSRLNRRFRLAALAGALAFAAQAPALAQSASAQPSPAALEAARAACTADLQQLCAGVQPGGGRILACLKEHRDKVSPGCRQAVVRALQGAASAGSAPGDAAPAPVPSQATAAAAGASSEAGPAAAAGSAAKAPVAAHSDSGSARYYQLKLAKTTTKNEKNVDTTVYTMLIPADWQLNGGFTSYTGGGCFADFIQVSGVAKSGDGAYGVAVVPQSTFQYADDPGLRKQMEQRNRLDEQFKIKACPIKAPMRAADFIRDLLWQTFKDKPQVSSEPFPELEQLVRSQQGVRLPGDAAVAGAPRVEAVRVRASGTSAKGEPVDVWMSGAVVVRTVPTGGRGAAYDWHVERLFILQTPRGELDGYDKLYRVMANSVRMDPQFQAWSDGMVATLSQKRQEEARKQSAMIAAFQQHVIETINEVNDNRERGANQAAFGQDQLIRGVQTFHDPGTGRNVELSNLYDHAWANGNDQYIMSDDPNFNPNGQLNGDWSQMQVVRPQP